MNWIKSYMRPLSCDQVYFSPSRRIIEMVEQGLLADFGENPVSSQLYLSLRSYLLQTILLVE